MWPFARRPVSVDMQDWIDANFDWASGHFGARNLSSTPLVTPTREYFRTPRGGDDAAAQAVFTEIRHLLRMADAHVTLVPQGSLPDQAAVDYRNLAAVAGTYIHDDADPIITYDPKLLRLPIVFISTMAHELMHLRLAPHIDDLPGGAAAHELATDLHCIIAGFGLFQMDAAERLGWAGYMSQTSRAYALAAFLHRTATPLAKAQPFLSARNLRRVKRAASVLVD